MSKALACIQEVLKIVNDYYNKNAAHGYAGGSSTGIIGLLDVCESDFSTEFTKITEAEDIAKHAYEAETKERLNSQGRLSRRPRRRPRATRDGFRFGDQNHRRG